MAHWPSIACPTLLLCGESDPFARIDLLRAAMPSLPHGELVTWPRLGHTLKPVLDEALDRAAAFILACPPCRPVDCGRPRTPRLSEPR